MSEIKMQAVREYDYGSAKVLKSDLLLSKKIIPVVGKAFSLKEARQAHDLSQIRHSRGRIIFLISK